MNLNELLDLTDEIRKLKLAKDLLNEVYFANYSNRSLDDYLKDRIENYFKG